MTSLFSQSNIPWDGGAGTNLWHDANNWTPNAVPAQTAGEDVVRFPNVGGAPYTVNINAPTDEIERLLFQSNLPVTLTGGPLNLNFFGNGNNMVINQNVNHIIDATIGPVNPLLVGTDEYSYFWIRDQTAYNAADFLTLSGDFTLTSGYRGGLFFIMTGSNVLINGTNWSGNGILAGSDYGGDHLVWFPGAFGGPTQTLIESDISDFVKGRYSPNDNSVSGTASLEIGSNNNIIFQNGGKANQTINFNVNNGHDGNTSMGVFNNYAYLTVDGVNAEITTIGLGRCSNLGDEVSLIGGRGHGQMDVTNGGTVTVGTDLYMGSYYTNNAGLNFRRSDNKDAILNIDGAGTTYTVVGNIDGGRTGATGSVEINVSNNALLDIQNNWAFKCTFGLDNSTLASNNALLNVTSNGLVTGNSMIENIAGIIKGDGGTIDNDIDMEGGQFFEMGDAITETLTLNGSLGGGNSFIQEGGNIQLTMDNQITNNNDFDIKGGKLTIDGNGIINFNVGDFILRQGTYIIDLAGGSSILEWENFQRFNGNIEIWNWDGIPTTDAGVNTGGDGTDQIIFSGAWTNNQLANNITFFNDNGQTNLSVDGNYQLSDGEIVPGVTNAAPNIDCSGLPTTSYQCLSEVPDAYANFTAFTNAGGSASDPDGTAPAANGLDVNTFALSSSNVNRVGCTFTITRTYEISDNAGSPLSDNCQHVITVTDNTAPTFSVCPGDVTESVLLAGDTDFNVITLGSPVAVDNCGAPVTYSYTINGGDEQDSDDANQIYNLGVNTVQWFAKDSCENKTSIGECTSIVTINNIGAPVIVCPDPTPITCTDDIVAGTNDLTVFEALLGSPSATDSDGDLDVSTLDFTDGTIPSNNCGTQFIRTYQISDLAGNQSNTCEHIYNINDNIAPTFDNCPGDVTVSIDAPGDTDAVVSTITSPSASDNCTGGSITYSYTIDGGIEQIKIDANGTFPLGTSEIQWFAEDACGNKTAVDVCPTTVTVTAVGAPVLVCPDPTPLNCIGDRPNGTDDLNTFLALSGNPSATDSDGDLDVNSLTFTDGTVPNSNCGTQFIRTYQISDLAGNPSNTCDHVFNINDVLAPTFSQATLSNITEDCTADAQAALDAVANSLTATGACGDVITIQQTTVDLELIKCGGTAQVTYTAANVCDASITSELLQDITINTVSSITFDDANATVINNETITGLGDISELATDDGSWLDQSNVATACSNIDFTVSVGNPTEQGNRGCITNWERVYTVTDECNNEDTFTQTIEVTSLDLQITLTASETELCDGETSTVTASFSGSLANQVTDNMLSWVSDPTRNARDIVVTNGGVASIQNVTETITVNATTLGCPDPVTETSEVITLYPKPSDDIPDPACAGADNIVILTSNVSGTGIKYNWSPSQGAVVTSGANSQEATIDVSASTQSQVTLIITNAGDCASDPIVVPLIRGPEFAVSPALPASGCAPLTTNISASSTDESGLSYEWTILGSVVGTTSDGESLERTIDSVGTHDVSVTATSAATGCSTTEVSVAAINVLPMPIASFQASQTVLVLDTPETSFLNNSQNANLYRWDFGEFVDQTLDVGNKDAVEYRYSTGGDFLVTLTALNTVDTMTCQSTDTLTIRVIPLLPHIPNVIRPDGNISLNTAFLPLEELEAINIETYILHVFNRWGNRIFETTDVFEAWTGKLPNGNSVSQGAYVYRIKFEDIQGNPHEIVGTLMVLD